MDVLVDYDRVVPGLGLSVRQEVFSLFSRFWVVGWRGELRVILSSRSSMSELAMFWKQRKAREQEPLKAKSRNYFTARLPALT